MDRDKKIVMFPGAENRLLTSALAALKDGNYTQALQEFDEVLRFKPGLEEGLYGRLICLMELGYLREVVEDAEFMLEKGIGEYSNILFFYISALVELGEWDEVIAAVEAARAQKQLPERHAMQFDQFLETAQSMKAQIEKDHQPGKEVSLDKEKEELLSSSEKLQWAAFQRMKLYSWESGEDVFTAALLHRETSWTIKTLILLLLKDWGVSTEAQVRKQDEMMTVPRDLPGLKDYEKKRREEVLALIDSCIGQQNPVLFDTISQLWEWVSVMHYPFPLPAGTSENWAAALHRESLRYMGASENWEDFVSLYDADREQVSELTTFFQNVNEQHVER